MTRETRSESSDEQGPAASGPKPPPPLWVDPYTAERGKPKPKRREKCAKPTDQSTLF